MDHDRYYQLRYGTQIMVSKPWSAVNMEYYIGDQDQGVRVEFERK
jgi:hypothetical protein